MVKLHRPKAGLLLIQGQKQTMIELSKDRMTLGRKKADIEFEDPKASSLHAEISYNKKGWRLKDLGSTNGTYLNKLKIEENALTDQDVIEIGLSSFCFFENLEDYYGPTRKQAPEASAARELTQRTLTTSKTLAQPTVEIRVVAGPDEGKTFRLKKHHITIGRGTCDVVLLDVDVSRTHAVIEVLGPSVVYLKDLGSTNGTFIGEKKISAEKISSEDKLKIGNSTLQVTWALPEEAL